jgi:hypothetical protein
LSFARYVEWRNFEMTDAEREAWRHGQDFIEQSSDAGETRWRDTGMFKAVLICNGGGVGLKPVLRLRNVR